MSLAGKTAIVTGANKGMGFQTALALAAKECKVILADRVNQTESMNKIAKETGNENLRTEYLDLSNLESVRAFARNIQEKETKLDILINNAGIFCMNKQKTVDRLDGVMQVNHLGPFLLTNLLVDIIKQSKEGRIVFVTSSGAFFHNMSVDKLQEPDYFFPHFVSGAIHYYNTKLCNMVTSVMFAKELKKFNVASNCLHPGMTSTDFLVSNAGNDPFGRFKRNATLEVLKCTTKDVKMASHMQTFVATSPTLKNVTGQYFADYTVHRPPSVLEDERFCSGIWEESKILVGLS